VAVPCDANGQSLSYASPDSNGFYEMNGTEQWIIKQTYFSDSVIDSFKANPDSSRSYLYVASPLEYLLEPYTSMSIRYGGIGSRSSSGNPLGASAGNNSNQQWWYSASPYGSGPLNGSVTVDVLGQLVSYFKVDWYDGYGGSAPANETVPDHINLLLNTDIGASAGVSFGSSGMTSGLSAQATASDGSPFGETAAAGAGLNDAGTSMGLSGTPLVTGYHVVRAGVDPVTHIATVYLDGTAHYTASNTVPYGTLPDGTPNGGQVTNGPTRAYAASGVSGGVKPDDREVAISSAIETSYFKSPDGYSGSPIPVQHYRNPDGSIAVDSIVFPVNDPQIGQHFIVGHTYYSNASSFTFPKFAWSVTGDGTPDSMTTANLGRTPDHPNGFTDLPATLDFGKTWDLTQTKASQFQVNVTDSDGVIAVNTYNVTWHAPQENFKVITLQRNVPKLVGGLQDIVVNATIPANLSIPGQEGKVDWGEAEHTGGLLVAVTGTGAGALLLPEVASGPPGWTGIVAQAILAGMSYKMGLAEATHPGTVPIEGNADYNEYLTDLNHQVAINQQPDGQKDMVRFNPPDLAEQALAASQAPDHWGSDSYFMGCTAQWQGGWYTDIADSVGDGYDVNGYVGSVPAHSEIPTHLFKRFVWTCTYRATP